MNSYFFSPYGKHKWPDYYRELLKCWRNFAQLAKCCDDCRESAARLVGQDKQEIGKEEK